jgi:hypothetical protein
MLTGARGGGGGGASARADAGGADARQVRGAQTYADVC